MLSLPENLSPWKILYHQYRSHQRTKILPNPFLTSLLLVIWRCNFVCFDHTVFVSHGHRGFGSFDNWVAAEAPTVGLHRPPTEFGCYLDGFNTENDPQKPRTEKLLRTKPLLLIEINTSKKEFLELEDHYSFNCYCKILYTSSTTNTIQTTVFKRPL